jgi:phosphatidyl-myo-inositol dimannoside synthase
MKETLRIVMLLTDGFGGTGGIAKFNRDFLQALDASSLSQRVDAFPRLISEPISDPIPESVVYFRKAANGKVSFARQVLARACRREGVDLVICGHMNLLPLAWLLARLRGARLALILHGIESWTPSSGPFNRMVRSVDAFIAVSRHVVERFTVWSMVDQDRISILPNCVDLDRFVPAPRDPKLAERYGVGSSKIILTMGRIAAEERYKGFDEVIEVMPQLLRLFPALKYMIVGDGADRARLQAKARSSGISDKVIFAGWIPESEKVAHYALADAYVMPSYGEGFGIVLIEAAACGVPVIGSLADGSREALLDGRLGSLVDPGKPNELVEAVAAVLEGGHRRERNNAIETFDDAHFRARVAEWLERQAAIVGRATAAGG